MNLSQKCQYGLRALLELAKHFGQSPTTINEIAEAQAIPPRFLEQILAQLRQKGYVDSRRGVQGGYMMAISPAVLSVGEVIRFFEGPLSPVRCIAPQSEPCALFGHCAFMGLWQRAQKAVEEIYDSTTFQDLIEEEQAAQNKRAVDWCI